MSKNFFIIIIILIISLICLNQRKLNNFIPKPKTDMAVNCSIKQEEKTVRGNSMSPYIVSGTKIIALQGYYNCHKIKRGDIVLFKYSGDKNPLIKIVKGIPDDKFALEKEKNGWHILVNDKVVKNLENKPYILSGNKHKMLSLYEKDYKGIIPPNSYLLLGDIPFGSTDSTAFGLINRSSIIAKVNI